MAGESIEQEKAATRRRWLTLAELLAVAAVAISALTLWDNHSDRARQREAQTASASKASAEAATMVLRGTPDREGGRIALAALREDQAIQAQTFAFPTALGVDAIDTAGDPRIESGWFADGLKKALKAAERDDTVHGDERVPVLIGTRFLVDGRMIEDRTLYDIGVKLDGQFLGGERVRLRGLSLVSHVKSGDGRRQLDARWAQLHPRTGAK